MGLFCGGLINAMRFQSKDKAGAEWFQIISSQLTRVEHRIAMLSAIRESLQRALLEAGDKPGDKSEIRISSVDRVLLERQMILALEIADERGLSTKELFADCRALSPMLKFATFRSRLYRLKSRSLVVREKDRWRLAKHLTNEAIVGAITDKS